MAVKMFKNVRPFAIEGEQSGTFTIQFSKEDLETMRDIFHEVTLSREVSNSAFITAYDLKAVCNEYLQEKK